MDMPNYYNAWALKNTYQPIQSSSQNAPQLQTNGLNYLTISLKNFDINTLRIDTENNILTIKEKKSE
jgi:hypothetical protein